MKKISLLAMVILGTSAAAWAQTSLTNLPAAPPIPTTNTLQNTTSVTNNPTKTNELVRVSDVDTTQLVKQMSGTDNITRQKVVAAIEAIQAGNNQRASALLMDLRNQNHFSDAQEKAVDDVIEQLRRP